MTSKNRAHRGIPRLRLRSYVRRNVSACLGEPAMRRLVGVVIAVVAVLCQASGALALTDPDTVAPVLSSFSRTSDASLVAGSPVTIDFAVTESGSGLSSVIFTYL